MAVTKTAEIQQFLRNVDYPASREDLLAQARELGADDETLDLIALMPNQSYQTPADISEAIEAASAQETE